MSDERIDWTMIPDHPDAARKLRLVVEPKVTDGDTWCVCANAADLWNTLQTYADEHGRAGERITIELRPMTDAQVESLPKI